MKIPPALLAALWLAPLPTLHALEPVTLDSLLHEMVDVESIARWPEHEFTCKQASSHDRKKVAPDHPVPGSVCPLRLSETCSIFAFQGGLPLWFYAMLPNKDEEFLFIPLRTKNVDHAVDVSKVFGGLTFAKKLKFPQNNVFGRGKEYLVALDFNKVSAGKSPGVQRVSASEINVSLEA